MGSKEKVKLLNGNEKWKSSKLHEYHDVSKLSLQPSEPGLLATQVNRKIQRFVLFGFDFAQVCPNTHEGMHNRSFGPVLI